MEIMRLEQSMKFVMTHLSFHVLKEVSIHESEILSQRIWVVSQLQSAIRHVAPSKSSFETLPAVLGVPLCSSAADSEEPSRCSFVCNGSG